ncbi:tetratricopeptide repeat protein [Candidatus Pacearchaeota archaeon]|nr:tetratricopeptide repeat protein [Candidatus Pacearchaeota archaeon]
MQIKSKALTHFNNKEFQKAKELYLKICKKSPNAESCYMLGMTYGLLSDFVNSEKWLKKASQLNPHSDVIFNNLGISQMSQRKYDQAISSLSKSISLNPKNTHSLNCLGNIYRDQGNSALSEDYFQQSLKIEPNNYVTLNNLGNIYLGKCIYNKALDYYQKSTAINPTNFETIYNIGCVYQSLGQHEKAIKQYNLAQKINPSSILVVAAIANSYEKQGNNNKAIESIQPYLNLQHPPSDLINTYARACLNLKDYNKGINVIKKLIDNSTRTQLNPIQNQELHFTLGDLYNKSCEYDKAFNEYEIANQLRPYTYNKNQTEEYFQSIKNIFSNPQLISNNTSNTPIFIIGMPRSGTSLIEQIISSHSEVYGAGELSSITEIANRAPSKSPYPNSINDINTSFLNKESEKHITYLKEISNDSEYIIDKMPHNFMYVGLIKMLFPNSKIIHCLRNPLDICLSIYFHNFNSNHPYSDKLENLGHYYNQYRYLMQHWENKHKDIYNISYELLLNEPDQQIKSMIKHLGLDWEDSCLEFYNNKRTVSTPSYSQVRQPLYKSSANRWKNYSNHIDDLIQSVDKEFL